jgi:TolA-binding protein
MKQFNFLIVILIVGASVTGYSKSQLENRRALEGQAKQQQLLVELTGHDGSKVSDLNLYAQIVGAYDSGDEIGFKSRMQSLLKRFPQSPYADNAFYLAGLMAVNAKNYPDAIRYFSKVEKEYATGDKVNTALFARAMTYKKINLGEFSKRLLIEVKTKFPGSPESFRAEAELKMIK